MEDVMPIATGLEREEIEAELQVSPVAAASFLITGYLLVKKLNFVGYGLFCCTGKEEIRHGRARRSLWHQGERFLSAFPWPREQLGPLN